MFARIDLFAKVLVSNACRPMKKLCYFLFPLFGFVVSSYAQEGIQRVGNPLVQQHPKSEYQAGNQNWGLAFGPEGFLYAANHEGLLVFDGQYWSLYSMPGTRTVRSVAVDSIGRIYTGGLSEFGYWERQADGQLLYQSISELLEAEDQITDEVWKITIQRDRIIFQTFSTLYIYQHNRLQAIRADGQPYLFHHYAGGRVFVELLPSGIHELKGDKFVPVPGLESISGKNVLAMLDFSPTEILIGTAKDGLFLLSDDGTLRPWQTEADGILKSSQLNNGISIFGGHYAFGTILNGIVVLDKQGRLVQHINKSNGLQNNTILSLETDRQQNIWAGLDNGIDRLEINSPLYFFSDKTGNIGTVYTAQLYQGYIYLGTNQGLYYSPWPVDGRYQAFGFKLVAHSQGQVWDLSIVNGELLCGHNDGTFRVKRNAIEKISDVTGGWTFLRLADNPGKMLQGTYTGVAVFEHDGNSWKFSNRLAGFRQPVQFIQDDGKGDIWVSGYQGLYRLSVDNTHREVKTVEKYDARNGLPQSTFTNPFNLSGKLVFATDSGFYQYDAITDRFSVYESLNEKIGSFAYSNKIIPAGRDDYWFVNSSRLAFVQLHAGGEIAIDSAAFSTLNGRMMKYYESINPLNSHSYLISLDNGFGIYQRVDDTKSTTAIPAPIIRALNNITDSLSGGWHVALEKPEIAYRNNNIRISYASPWFTANPLKYQYYLQGYSRTWSAWSETAQREFTNLRHGDYRFLVRAMAPDGTVSGVTALDFRILPPWYLTWWAILGYLLLLALLAWGIKNWYARKIHKHRRLVQEKMKTEQDQLLRQEAYENEQRLIKIKNEQLERELKNKNRELANAATSIVYKNDLLTNVHDELLALKDADGRKLSSDQLRKINKIIEDARSDERDWNLFENSFNETHENFFKKLKGGYPELVPNDLKLCAYLHMNMTSKEIASLLNITTRGVEIRRYRLRKKLNIPHEKNLSEFLMEL